jgi:hypothetical protein
MDAHSVLLERCWRTVRVLWENCESAVGELWECCGRTVRAGLAGEQKCTNEVRFWFQRAEYDGFFLRIEK